MTGADDTAGNLYHPRAVTTPPNPNIVYFEIAAKSCPEPFNDQHTLQCVRHLVTDGYDVTLRSWHRPASIELRKDGQMWAVTADSRYEAISELMKMVNGSL